VTPEVCPVKITERIHIKPVGIQPLNKEKSDDKSSTSAVTLRPGRYGKLRISTRTSAKSGEDQNKIRPEGWVYPTDLKWIQWRNGLAGRIVVKHLTMDGLNIQMVKIRYFAKSDD
jgi:hypothetical protein